MNDENDMSTEGANNAETLRYIAHLSLSGASAPGGMGSLVGGILTLVAPPETVASFSGKAKLSFSPDKIILREGNEMSSRNRRLALQFFDEPISLAAGRFDFAFLSGCFRNQVSGQVHRDESVFLSIAVCDARNPSVALWVAQGFATLCGAERNTLRREVLAGCEHSGAGEK